MGGNRQRTSDSCRHAILAGLDSHGISRHPVGYNSFSSSSVSSTSAKGISLTIHRESLRMASAPFFITAIKPGRTTLLLYIGIRYKVIA